MMAISLLLLLQIASHTMNDILDFPYDTGSLGSAWAAPLPSAAFSLQQTGTTRSVLYCYRRRGADAYLDHGHQVRHLGVRWTHGQLYTGEA